MQDYKVKHISQAYFGRKEISLAETEMPGLMAVRAEYKKLQETALKELDKFMTQMAGGGDFTDTAQIESLQEKISAQIKNIINLIGNVQIVPIKSLPNDGKVIDDIRDFGE